MFGYFVIDTCVEVDVVPCHSTTSNAGGCGADLPTLADANTEVDGVQVVMIRARASCGSTLAPLHGHDNTAHLIDNLDFVE